MPIAFSQPPHSQHNPRAPHTVTSTAHILTSQTPPPHTHPQPPPHSPTATSTLTHSHPNISQDVVLFLENLTARMHQPVVMDIKMGTRTFQEKEGDNPKLRCPILPVSSQLPSFAR